jgi:hypothetical protein
MLALLDVFAKPVVDRAFDELLDILLADGEIVAVFPITGVECKYEG